MPRAVGTQNANIHLNQLALELRQPLFELRVEPNEVQLVDFAKVVAAGRVHAIEPIQALVRDVLSERLVKLARQLGCNGQATICRAADTPLDWSRLPVRWAL